MVSLVLVAGLEISGLGMSVLAWTTGTTRLLIFANNG